MLHFRIHDLTLLCLRFSLTILLRVYSTILGSMTRHHSNIGHEPNSELVMVGTFDPIVDSTQNDEDGNSRVWHAIAASRECKNNSALVTFSQGEGDLTGILHFQWKCLLHTGKLFSLLSLFATSK